jgi:hypothetical protein
MDTCSDVSFPRLDGLRIALSGAIPPREEWIEPAQDLAILEFLRDFSAQVFKLGGCIVHGSHPTFAPVLARQAERCSSDRAPGKQLTLMMSDLWAPEQSRVTLEYYRRVAKFEWIKAVGEGGPEVAETRNASLRALREHMLKSVDVVVAIGGVGNRPGLVPGVEEELNLSRDRGLPCFLVGRLGGQTHRLSRDRLAQLSKGNQLRPDELRSLVDTEDVAGLAGRLVTYLARYVARMDGSLAKLRSLAEPFERSNRRGQLSPALVASMEADSESCLVAYMRKRPKRRQDRDSIAHLFGRSAWKANAAKVVSADFASMLINRQGAVGFLRVGDMVPT